MNSIQQVLFQGIQKSLWNANIMFPDNTDWDAVISEAEDQAVLGIVIGAAPEDVRERWRSKANLVTAHFVRILHYQEQLYRLLKEHGIPMVILKGTAAAIYYPNPSQRSMGDIDYLVPMEHFDRTKELLVENGYSIADDPRNPRHMHVYKGRVSFEQHRFFSSEGIDVELYITEGISHIHINKIYDREFPMLPKLANGFVLLGHMAQHLKTGLGLRQVIDWMMYVNSELDDAFWTLTFEKAAIDVGLDQVAIVATRMCQLYLGLSEDIHWCMDADPEACAALMDSLLSSGNFNRKRGNGTPIEVVVSNIGKKGLFRVLQTSGEKNWEAYHKHKWLKPFAWIYQGCRYVAKGIQTKRSGIQIKQDAQRGKQRKELLQKLKILANKEDSLSRAGSDPERKYIKET